MILDLGRFQLGDFVPLFIPPMDENGVPGLPDTGNVTVWDASSVGSSLATAVIPKRDDTPTFFLALPLDGTYAAGKTYIVTYEWTVGGDAMGGAWTFEVVAGGDTEGAILGMTAVGYPAEDQIVYLTDAGTLRQGRV